MRRKGKHHRSASRLGPISPEQRAIFEQIEYDLRIDGKRLSNPCLDEVPYIREVRELLQQTHDLIGSILLERVAGWERPDPATDRILQKIAEDS